MAFAHSMLTALRHPACACQQRRLSGHGQPLTDAASRSTQSLGRKPGDTVCMPRARPIITADALPPSDAPGLATRAEARGHRVRARAHLPCSCGPTQQRMPTLKPFSAATRSPPASAGGLFQSGLFRLYAVAVSASSPRRLRRGLAGLPLSLAAAFGPPAHWIVIGRLNTFSKRSVRRSAPQMSTSGS